MDACFFPLCTYAYSTLEQEYLYLIITYKSSAKSSILSEEIWLQFWVLIISCTLLRISCWLQFWVSVDFLQISCCFYGKETATSDQPAFHARDSSTPALKEVWGKAWAENLLWTILLFELPGWICIDVVFVFVVLNNCCLEPSVVDICITAPSHCNPISISVSRMWIPISSA